MQYTSPKFSLTPAKINILLLLSSLFIYSIYFGSIFLHLNSLLSGVNADSLKNYYTFVYHIKNDPTFLHFSGLNFPFGEHIVYTDCQPVITFLLRCLPFTHDYLIGILHGLVFLSFIVTPLVINKIFIRLNVDKFSSFFISLAITLLSPQYHKIVAGHYALSYACVIPLCILLLLNVLTKKSKLNLSFLFLFNSILFFLHPYLGVGVSLFSFISILAFDILNFYRKTIILHVFQNIFCSILPIVLFKLFLGLTDHHLNRASETENATTLVSNMGSLILPSFGPFQEFLPKVFGVKSSNFEGFGYLGIFLITLTLVTLILLPIIGKKIKLSRDMTSIFIASLVLLFFAFGLHNDLLLFLKIKLLLVEQFRASGRFIWFFYYSFPLFLIPMLYHLFQKYTHPKKALICFNVVAIFFFAFNLLEANSLFQQNRMAYWKFKNFFSKSHLTSNEVQLLKTIQNAHVTALIPLPIYLIGSEVYSRPETEFMSWSMLCSFHCNLPIVGSYLSRTSITETENIIQILNSYKKEHALTSFLGDKRFILLKTGGELFPDEERLYSKGEIVFKDSLLEALLLKENKLFERVLTDNVVKIESGKMNDKDTNNILFIASEQKKPFLKSNMEDYEIVCALDSNRFRSGNYIVSLHYYYSEKNHKALSCHLIINRVTSISALWEPLIPIKHLSGFYNNYCVFEKNLYLDRHSKYDFMLRGNWPGHYRISNFLIRPEKTSVLLINGKDSTFNNFPD